MRSHCCDRKGLRDIEIEMVWVHFGTPEAVDWISWLQ
jgi:hypothetical protein